MYGNMVSFKDYEHSDGFAPQTQEEINDLNKALNVGQDRDPPGSAVAGDGFAMRTESLERTLKNVTYKAENIRFWRSIPKIPAYNTVEEFNRILSYGDNIDGDFIDEGDLPETDDSTYERNFSVVKYLGTTREVSHVASVIKPAHGNLIAQETVAGTMKLLRTLEQSLFFARSDIQPLQFDGFEKLIEDNAPAANVIDLRGAPLTEDNLIDGALTIQDDPGFGIPTHLHLNPKAKADLIKGFFPRSRYDLLEKTDGGDVGLDIRGFSSPAGRVSFESNVFIRDGGAPNATARGDAAKRPATPVVGAPSAAANAASQFVASDAGDYDYSVVAVNRFGRSVAVDAGAAVTVAAGESVTISVTPGSGPEPEYYALYRTAVDGTDKRLIARIPNTNGASAQSLVDSNESLPFTTTAFLLQQNTESLSFKQLAPMVKIPLATISSSIRWMQLIYGVPVLYAPAKNVIFKNVGRAANFVGAP